MYWQKSNPQELARFFLIPDEQLAPSSISSKTNFPQISQIKSADYADFQ
jgi:hypothetical protein